MKSLFSSEAYEDILSRLHQLDENSQAKWGKMDISQMLAHCQFPLEVALGELQLDKPNIFKRTLFSLFKSSLYNDKPWKQSLPTANEFVVTTEKKFSKEKTALKDKIEQFHAEKNKTEWPPHPMFGKFTHEQWGKMQYKHLDHHFKQFGV